MAGKDNKLELLYFLDIKVFGPILHAVPGNLKEEEKEEFEDIRRKTENEKKQFYQFESAEEVKRNYLSDVRSKAAVKINQMLEKLGLPTLPEYKGEFLELCKDLGV